MYVTQVNYLPTLTSAYEPCGAYEQMRMDRSSQNNFPIQADSTGTIPHGRPRTWWMDYIIYPIWPVNDLLSHRWNWEVLLGKGKSGILLG